MNILFHSSCTILYIAINNIICTINSFITQPINPFQTLNENRKIEVTNINNLNFNFSKKKKPTAATIDPKIGKTSYILLYVIIHNTRVNNITNPKADLDHWNFTDKKIRNIATADHTAQEYIPIYTK
jgi:hypothetical protein